MKPLSLRKRFDDLLRLRRLEEHRRTALPPDERDALMREFAELTSPG